MEVKIGILGTGDISHDFMKSATNLNLKVVGVAQRNLEKAKNFANLYHIPYAFSNLSELLTVDLNIVYIGLPNSLHYENAKQCLIHGKHVLLEKPVTIYKEEFDELIEIAHQNNVFLLEVDRVEHLPAYQLIKQNMNDQIKLIQIDFCKRSRRYDDYLNHQLPHIFDREYGGGALYDLGVYALHFVIGLIGSPKSFTYICEKGRGNVDMMGILLLSYETCLVNITLSKISHGKSRVLLQGENDQIMSDSAPSRLQGLKINDKFYDIHDHNFTCFLKETIRIITEKDEFTYERLTKKSQQVIYLLNEIFKTID